MEGEGRFKKETIAKGPKEEIEKSLYEDEIFLNTFLLPSTGWQFNELGAILPEGYKRKKNKLGQRVGKRLFISLENTPLEKIHKVTILGNQEANGNRAGVSDPVIVKIKNPEDKYLDGKSAILFYAYTGLSCKILIRGAIVELK